MQRRKFLSGSAITTLAAVMPLSVPFISRRHPESVQPGPLPAARIPVAGSMTPVSTRSYDNARSCANPNETVLNASNVGTRGIKKLFSLPVPGDKRGCEAQPLIVPAVKMADGSTHDLAVLASMANGVFAYDANDGSLLWQVNLGNPIQGSKNLDLYLINDHWGILSTPVIDPDSNMLYCVTWTSPDGTASRAMHSFHALRLSDGMAAHPALSLQGAVYNPGNGLPVQLFSAIIRKQRCGLLLTKVNNVKTVFIGCGTVSETDPKARGWILAVDLASFKLSAAFATAARFSGGGIWQAAQGLAADSKGFIHCMTSNGAFDGKTEWGECFLKLKYTPPAPAKAASLKVVDWWSPFSDSGRIGKDPTLPNAKEGGDQTAANDKEFDDQDLGSGGPVCIEEYGLLAGAGKDGILYVTNLNNMGKTSNHDFSNPAVNYAKLKSQPVWFTFYPGNGVSAAPQKVTDIDQYYNNLTHHQHSTPVVYDSPVHGKMLFTWGENGNLRAWSIDQNGVLTYLACSAELASPNAARTNGRHGGMPGGMLSLSCNGKTPGAGLLWALVPLDDANSTLSPGYLYCYDADNFTTFSDGSRGLKLLWNSGDWNLNFTHPKFNVPVVSGGKVFVPTYDARVDVYGLA
jgi:outer membrane protein assembly factor BamB